MIKDKEYPATHSMSTAWFMVDADGNVGLMSFEDNGPVPAYSRVEPETAVEDLFFGQPFADFKSCEGVDLNKLQIHELLGNPIKPDALKRWDDVCLAIAPDRIQEFLTLCSGRDINNYGCVSSDMNLYFVDTHECISYENKVVPGSSLDRMLKADIIQDIYIIPELEMDSVYRNEAEALEFTKNFDNAPFYIYYQPYSLSHLQHRMNVPRNPVKVTQIDGRYHDRLLHVPLRFKDTEEMQIAQWFVCGSYADQILIGNAGYSLFPVQEHTRKYCLTAPFLFDFYEYCPEMGNYKCAKCNQDCASTVRLINTLTPTVLYIVDPAIEHIDISRLDFQKEIKDKMAVFSYVPKFPYKKDRCWMSIEKVAKMMTAEVLASLLDYSKGWFENLVRSVNPHVIIADHNALPVLSTVFPVTDNELIVNNISYPIFEVSSVNENIERIMSLADSPYRGEVFPMTYTAGEVKNLHRRRKVSEFE